MFDFVELYQINISESEYKTVFWDPGIPFHILHVQNGSRIMWYYFFICIWAKSAYFKMSPVHGHPAPFFTDISLSAKNLWSYKLFKVKCS